MALVRLRKYRIFLAVSVCCLLAVYLFSQGTGTYAPAKLPGFGLRPDGAATFPWHNDPPPPSPATPGQDKLSAPETPHMEVPPGAQNPNDPQPPKPAFGPEPEEDDELDDDDELDASDEAGSKTEHTRPHWKPKEDRYPVPPGSTIPLPTGTSKPIPKIQHQFLPESSAEKAEREKKLEAVKASMQRAWAGYRAHAWMKDELRPQSGGHKEKFNGWGATLVDSLDTLWIMGMKTEFEEALKAVQTIDFTTSTGVTIPMFETTIRYLGGLLGAYDVSGGAYPVLLEKAKELGNVLIGAFDTPNRMPILYFTWKGTRDANSVNASPNAVLAELGSLSLEFTRLSQLTNDPKFYDAVARIGNGLAEFQNRTAIPGLWPLSLDESNCQPGSAESDDDATDEHTVPEKDTTSWGDDADQAIDTDKKDPTPEELRQKDKTSFGQEPDAVAKRQESLDDNFSGDASAGDSDTADTGDDDDDDDDGDEGDSDETGEDGEAKEPPRKHCLAHLTGNYNDQFSIGGEGDSTYEYLPKEYLLLGGLDEQYKVMYTNAAAAIKDHLLFRAMTDEEDRELLFTGKFTVNSKKATPLNPVSGRLQPSVGHLSCFQGAMFAMGAKIFNRPAELEIGSKMTDACVWAYEKSASGIMPDDITPIPCSDLDHCPWNQTAWYLALDPRAASRPKASKTTKRTAQSVEYGNEYLSKRQMDEKTKLKETHQAAGTKANAKPNTKPHGPKPKFPKEHPADHGHERELTHEEYVQKVISTSGYWPGIKAITSDKYILRPEAIESVWYMYRITGDNSWREKGWAMFQAVEKGTKTEFGNSAIAEVSSTKVRLLDEAESFWTAETLKYFYLLFSEPDVICLDDYVLNTEAHPFLRPDSKKK